MKKQTQAPETTAAPVEVRRLTTGDELLAVFEWSTKVSALPELTENGKTYLPLCGIRIDPMLAALRAASPLWGKDCATAAYFVTYVPADSMAISAMGRMR